MIPRVEQVTRIGNLKGTTKKAQNDICFFKQFKDANDNKVRGPSYDTFCPSAEYKKFLEKGKNIV